MRSERSERSERSPGLPGRKTSLFPLIVGIGIILVASMLMASTDFTTTTNSYYGKEAIIHKLAVNVVPLHRDDPNDHNDVNSMADSNEAVYGELRRITLSATGTDTAFTVIVKDDLGVTLFSKTDCNTVLLPLSYALDVNNAIATRYPGILVAGPLTVETNDVNAMALTGINVTLYYLNPTK